jgi:hypothetical protein
MLATRECQLNQLLVGQVAGVHHARLGVDDDSRLEGHDHEVLNARFGQVDVVLVTDQDVAAMVD